MISGKRFWIKNKNWRMNDIELDAKTIQKYSKASLPTLIKKATKHFNAYIRERDARQPCISCGTWTYLQAGHFYSGGAVPRLRFNEDNVHGQCMPCNYFASGNLLRYRENLIKRIGQERVDELDRLSHLKGFKWNRYELIYIIEKYKGYK